MSHGETLVKQYAALLEVTESIAAHHDLSELFRDLASKLPPVIKCSAIQTPHLKQRLRRSRWN